MEEKLYTCQEIASAYKIPLKVIWEMIRNGSLPALKINGRNYRIKESTVKTFFGDAADKDNGQNDVLTCQDVAEYLKIKLRTVLLLIRKGELPAVEVAGGVYQIRKSDFESYVQRIESGKKS